ncbi:hypothetical protein BDD12DRAFT_860965 [Trichophaea hybrida]|nr:hypothetical protein BDD12DRAFT_860965 [Trichophaea hybrida]
MLLQLFRQNPSSRDEDGVRLLGLTVLNNGIQPIVDIIFVHGLGGYPSWTFSTKGVFWLWDLLSIDIPDARILTYGYTAAAPNCTVSWKNFARGGAVSRYLVSNYASDMLNDISDDRENKSISQGPIISYAIAWEGWW